jgi:nickel/cobalt transporter (NicO) family protein
MKRYLALSVFLATRLLAQTQGGLAGQPGGAQTDYLARLLHRGELPWTAIVIGMIVAFGLGAVHALSPGHGKTIVAAYLVGTRGTPGHAIFLGAMVTFTHTISVFLLGLTTLFLSRYVLPERIVPVLGLISGVSIVWIGAILFYQRMRAAQGLAPHQHDDHAPAHEHAHAHTHVHGHTHERTHENHTHDHSHEHHDHHHHGELVHDHGDGHVHSHVPDEVSLASLIALGASGGLVPCPSALVLLLSAIALGRVGLGLILLVAFSLGLAGVLMAVGLVVLYAKHLLPDSRRAHPAFRLLPVASAAIIVCIGLVMTAASLGFIRGPLAGV